MSTLKYALILLFFIISIPSGVAWYLSTQKVPVTYVNDTVQAQNTLNIPPLLEAQTYGDTLSFANLILQTGMTSFFNGIDTDTWGVNGSFLGPTIRIKKGQTLKLNIKNTLPESTTIHWHGAEVPAAMDGGPHQIIKPSASWSVTFPIVQEAATLWYHPHMMGKTAEHVYKGIAGFFIIDDENSENLGLPNDYGINDIPLVIQDRKFDEKGQLVYDHKHNGHMITSGMLGNTILVNGTFAPYQDIPPTLVRLRILNGSNARRYHIGFSDNRSFKQIATDGGLLEKPIERSRLMLSPGERAEIIVDFSQDNKVAKLISFPINPEPDRFRDTLAKIMIGKRDENQQFNLLEFRVQGQSSAQTKTLPEKLNNIAHWTEKEAVKKRTFRLSSSSINDLKMDMARIDEVVVKGDLELWDIINTSSINHPFHIHGAQFQILSRNGKKPDAHEMGWKDTVAIADSEKVMLAVKFDQYADPALPYMYHCHNLEHEDMGMMGQLIVVNSADEKIRFHPPAETKSHSTH